MELSFGIFSQLNWKVEEVGHSLMEQIHKKISLEEPKIVEGIL